MPSSTTNFEGVESNEVIEAPRSVKVAVIIADTYDPYDSKGQLQSSEYVKLCLTTFLRLVPDAE
ncbi:hypothetical protein J6590_044539 [Homalodisca vitripennis]|nr:hypothetical protein J6590_044539 [Homalodisca vitripennis]